MDALEVYCPGSVFKPDDCGIVNFELTGEALGDGVEVTLLQ